MKGARHRQAAWLARCYPRPWRARFPDFVDLLGLELAERPMRAVVSVLGAAFLERLRVAGLVPSTSAERARSGLALVVAALVPFAGLTAGMWSELHIGLDGAGPPAAGVFGRADLLLAVGVTLTVAGLVAAVVLLAARIGRRQRSGAGGGAAPHGRAAGPVAALARPMTAFVGSMAVLCVAGWAADRSGWYSPAAAALPGGVPASC